MKSTLFLLLLMLILLALLTACAPSQEAINATTTKVAADIFATQTALAPTVTLTATPSPTATITPTPTKTPTPTFTRTPLPTPTPTPGLSRVTITLDDLPAGFKPLPTEELKKYEKQMPDEWSGFGFSDDQHYELITGYLYPTDPNMPNASFDKALPQMVRIYPTLFEATGKVTDLTGLENIGEARAGVTAVSTDSRIPVRWDIVSFRRSNIVSLVVVAYPDGKKPDISYLDLAQLIDERIITYIYPYFRPSAAEVNSISGKWSGSIYDDHNSSISKITLDISAECKLSDVCGTVSEKDIPCSGEISLESISGSTFIFTERNMIGAAQCIRGGHEYVRKLANGKLLWRYVYTSPFGEISTTKALLTKQ